MNATHRKALEAAERFKRAEADLIRALQEVEQERVFAELGYTSLFNYCVQALGLSESVTANFVTVARKAREMPVLQAAIQNGKLSVSKARKITSVLTLENQADWLEKAKTLSSRRLEEEVARALPQESVRERMKIVSEDRVELRLGISRSVQEKLKRVLDLESQRTARAVRMEDALEALLDVYLESKDPLKRAERVLKRMTQPLVSRDMSNRRLKQMLGPSLPLFGIGCIYAMAGGAPISTRGASAAKIGDGSTSIMFRREAGEARTARKILSRSARHIIGWSID